VGELRDWCVLWFVALGKNLERDGQSLQVILLRKLFMEEVVNDHHQHHFGSVPGII
jgi:hypothetical protein